MVQQYELIFCLIRYAQTPENILSVSGDEQELELEKNVAYGHLQIQNLMETALN